MEWIETNLNTNTEWVEHTLVLNDFVLIKMSVLEGKVFLFTKSLDKYSDKEFSFFRSYTNRTDIDVVKQEIIDALNGKKEEINEKVI